MSAYSDYILSIGAEVQLPLEELVSEPVVNTGSAGGAVTGTHTLTLDHQDTLVYEEQYSMRYTPESKSEITMPLQLFGSMAMQIMVTEPDFTIFELSNSGVADSWIKLYALNDKLWFENSSALVDMELSYTIGNNVNFILTYDGNFIALYAQGFFVKNVNVTLVTDQFDTLKLGEGAVLTVEDLFDTDGVTVLTDGTNNLVQEV